MAQPMIEATVSAPAVQGIGAAVNALMYGGARGTRLAWAVDGRMVRFLFYSEDEIMESRPNAPDQRWEPQQADITAHDWAIFPVTLTAGED